MPFDFSMGELLVVLFVALLVFGGKLPDTARKLGHALSEFKRGMREELRKVDEASRQGEAPPQWRPGKPSPEKTTADKTAPENTEPAAAEPEESEAAADQPEAEPTRRDP